MSEGLTTNKNSGGRIVVSWNPSSFHVNIIKCTSQLIHLGVTTVDNKNFFFVTYVYVFNDEEGRKRLWKDLQDLTVKGPWIVMGDFNDILAKEERIGNRVRYKTSTDFIDCVANCQLEDVKYSGNFYTWCNKQYGEDRIYSKIDRVLANQVWLSLFPDAETVFLNEGPFDHTLAVLTVYSNVPCGTKMYRIITKLKALKAVFKGINAQGYSDIISAEIQARDYLAECQNKLQCEPLNPVLHVMELEARNKYTKELLGSKLLQRKKVLAGVMNQGPKVTELQSELLLKDYTKEEVRKVFFEIPGNKAPGPDGYGSFFYQGNWDLIGDEVAEAIISFLKIGQLLKEINTTVITLVPKTKCPNIVKDYRPIACCNVIYKAATKLICSRLKTVLPSIVAQNQGGFVQGRFIAHNIMIFQDLVCHYGRKSSKASCLIKLDLQKAYDTIEWSFIEEVLYGFHFPEHFIQLVMTCIRTPQYSLMLNGSMHGYFEAKRGLRQGDPMSPLIFVLGMEYLTRIMQKGLMLFSQTSRLQPNASKSAIYYSGMNSNEVHRILEASGFRKSDVPFHYLGVPICPKRISAKECSLLVDKMTNRIRSWSTRNISFAGRAVLINSVLLSIHSYWSQIMLLPKKVIKEIEAICRAFLWTGQQMMVGAGKIAWDSMCKPKAAGGIGFKNIAEWNKAAMFKYVWAVAAKEDNLWVRWVHSVYIKDGVWWDYIAPVHGSWYWRKVVAIKDQVKTLVDLALFPQRKYKIAEGYKLLSPVHEQVNWSKEFWGRLNTPKHSFILWLAIQDRLKTKARLYRFNVLPEARCQFCKVADETTTHLFFDCPFSSECLQQIKSCVCWGISACQLPCIMRVIGRMKATRFRKMVLSAIIAALVYHLWRARNESLWLSSLDNPTSIVQKIKAASKIRIQSVWPKKVSAKDFEWYTGAGFLVITTEWFVDIAISVQWRRIEDALEQEIQTQMQNESSSSAGSVSIYEMQVVTRVLGQRRGHN
ncbi:uncharacterized protein LOC133779445 [Humulus lupulus]|uniref:uncharacterized protein LOC133779445 n=1 Tax=Humulus lupulus TaxID=3486 RepID=UPI002B41235F|nr:uncharacterized protein LOC133779445 [Humulus lupulus]